MIKLPEPYVARDSDLALADAVDLYAKGEKVKAYEKIANAIVEDPANPRLPLTMCKLLRHEARYTEALKIIETLPPGIRDNPEIVQFRDLLTFYVVIEPTHNL